MLRLLGVVIALSIGLTRPLLSQEQGTIKRAQAIEQDSFRVLLDTLRVRATDPTLSSSLRIPVPKVLFETATENSVAQASMGVQGLNWGVSLTGKAPVRKGTDATTIADLSGLRTASTVGINLNRIHWGPGLDTAVTHPVCRRAGIDPNTEVCAKDALPETLQDDYDRGVDYGVRLVWSAGAEIGRELFEFVDRNTLTGDEVHEHPRSVGLGLGTYFFSGPLQGLWGVTFRNEWGYKAGDEVELCQPFGNTNATRCQTLTIGAPAENRASILSFEHRRFMSGAFAINPRVHYDLEEANFALEVPIYFLRAEGGLTGGLTVGWRSDEESIIAQVFVGSILGTLR